MLCWGLYWPAHRSRELRIQSERRCTTPLRNPIFVESLLVTTWGHQMMQLPCELWQSAARKDLRLSPLRTLRQAQYDYKGTDELEGNTLSQVGARVPSN